ncbi:MAG TPA: metallophosphoesterase [Niabella sp.]|nr:metallophosphoesterase [Niabella sp.]
MKRKPILRFALVSDIHYGEPKTDYNMFLKTLIWKINTAHSKKPLDFCVLNGDIVHDDPKFYPSVKPIVGQLKMKWHVTPGNHDKITPDEWMQIWDTPVNFDFRIKNSVFLAGTTSNEKGKYTCPNLSWFQEKLETYKEAKNLFVINHINTAKLTKHGIDCPEYIDLLKKYDNVRAVFNGHDHDEDGIKKHREIPFVFDAHAGGSWGTDYKGFRVVELMKDNSILTYMMNPDTPINNATL